MQYAAAHANDAAEIERLFIKVFSDSEGQTEGEMIGRLARDFMSGTGRQRSKTQTKAKAAFTERLS